MQWVKDMVVSFRQFDLLLWRGFDPWPRNVHVYLVYSLPKKKKKKKKKKNFIYFFFFFFFFL